ncbi:MAG: guanylate kinase [Pirellulales bacterium]
MSKQQLGKLVILSGPAGSGKSTVVRQLLDKYPGRLELSVSATTRKPRSGEVDGVAYHFLTEAQFLQKREAGEFLESFEVFGLGNWYGTLQCEVENRIQNGISVLLEIDVEGAMQVVEQYPHAVTIFLNPGSLEVLEQRLRGRKTETESVIQRRLEVAHQEMEMAANYKYQVINDKLEHAVEQICQIISNDPGEIVR